LQAWTEKTIADLGRVVTGKTPPTGDSQYWNGDELFISPKDLEKDALYITSTESRITDRAIDKFANQVLPPRSVMFTSLSFGFGKMGITSRRSLTNQQINSIIVNDKHDYRFVYYLLRAYTPFIFAFNSGIDTPIVPKSVFEKVKVLCPPLETQRKIAGILSAYDDLIENNRRRIAILEQMAEELYREWFVRMRFPGYQNTKFVKGVPEGWEIARLVDIAEVNPETVKNTNRPERIPYIDIGTVTTNRLGTPEEYLFTDAPGRARRIVRHGDVIWSSVRPGNRVFALIQKPIENLIVSTGFAVLRPKEGMPFPYLYQVVASQSFTDYLVSVAKGSAYPATSFEDFENAQVLKPSNNLLLEFNNVCLPLFTQVWQLSQAVSWLSESRNNLLPRLISGKLNVERLDLTKPPSMNEFVEDAQQELAHA
jgi:type I restriction enzyme, S subunit